MMGSTTAKFKDRRANFKSAPLVSVLFTSFNHARYVEEALDSLRRQTCSDFEVIIIDDASTDGCADVSAAWLDRTGFQAQFIRNKTNRGICANRNTALGQASGTFVCSLSGDDAYEPERIERQLQCFLSQPEDVCAVYSDMAMVDFEGKPQGLSYLESKLNGAEPPQGRIFESLLLNNHLPAPCVMLRKSAIEAVGGYDESLFYEDFDMWLRLSFRFRFAFLPARLVRFRTHDESMSHSPRFRMAMCSSRTRILEKWLDADLGDAIRSRLLDALFWNATLQLRIDDSGGARLTFDDVVRNDHRMTRRWLARVGKLRGACTIVQLMLPIYRLIRAARIGWSARRD